MSAIGPNSACNVKEHALEALMTHKGRSRQGHIFSDLTLMPTHGVLAAIADMVPADNVGTEVNNNPVQRHRSHLTRGSAGRLS